MRLLAPIFLVSALLFSSTVRLTLAQTGIRQAQTTPSPSRPFGGQEQPAAPDLSAEDELQKGTALTRKGDFSEAIPHLLAARGKVSNEYAASFNLALCYIATRQDKQGIEILNDLRHNGHDGADVENLLAQAYIGSGRADDAFAALSKAAAITPQNEKLYLLVADACMEHQDLDLGLKVVDFGLKNLSQSARLHYDRAILLSQLNRPENAKADFELAGKLGQGSDIAYVARAHEALLAGNVDDASHIAREGVEQGFENPLLLTLLGEALLRSGVTPGEAGFGEAQSALEKAVAARPNDADAQLALGQIDLASGRLDDAIAHLERARQIQPDVPSVYATLARAYQRSGDSQRAQQALATLQALNEAQAERIRSAPGERKMSYGGGDKPSNPR